MAYVNIANHNGFNLDGVLAALRSLKTNMVNRRVFRTTFTELNALSTRDLADLGINRSEIRRMAWEAAYGSKGQ
ncbi:MAG: DUF1127 domain-containing protein [Paracoccaceae bacterium]